MQGINLARVVLGGLVAGLIYDAAGFTTDGWLLKQDWAEATGRLGLTAPGAGQLLWATLHGLICGLAALWMYTAMRRLHGKGYRTAAHAGLLVWLLGVLLPDLSFGTSMGFFPGRLAVSSAAGGLAGLLAGTLAGAWLYRDN